MSDEELKIIYDKRLKEIDLEIANVKLGLMQNKDKTIIKHATALLHDLEKERSYYVDNFWKKRDEQNAISKIIKRK